MRRPARAVLGMLALAIGSPTLAPGPANAALERDAVLVTFNVAYAYTWSQITGDGMDGSAVNMTFEKLLNSRRWAFGLSVSWFETEEETTVEDRPTQLDYRTIPTSLTAKMVVGNPDKRVQGYLGFILGIQFSTLGITTEEDFRQTHDSGGTFGIPVGLMVWLGSQIYANVTYIPYWMSSDFYDNNFSNVFGLGLGAQFSD